MTQNLITVVTPTVGESAGRLGILCDDLRRYTRLLFNQIICDDGTFNVADQKIVTAHHHCRYLQNPGPVYGISYNLNHALDAVETPWAFLIEDGVRPSVGWLETAIEFIELVGTKEWAGHPIGMAGCGSLQDWHLAMGGVWPTDVMDVFHHRLPKNYFYDFSPGWNDGYWCWSRLMPKMIEACRGDISNWERDVLMTRQVLLDDIDSLKSTMHPTDVKLAIQKWCGRHCWPIRRQCYEGRYPGPFLIINMDAWRKVGKFRDGCTFFEGHLGIRMQMHGYLTLCLEGPPFLHYPSQGFSETSMARTPRHHEDTRELFLRDFGHDNMDAPNAPEIINREISQASRELANAALSKVILTMEEGWKKYA